MDTLSADVVDHLFSYLPVRCLLGMASVSKWLETQVAEPKLWIKLTGHLCPLLKKDLYLKFAEMEGTADATVSNTGSDTFSWKASFMRRAKSELRWRKGHPVKVTQQQLRANENGDIQALQSLVLWTDNSLGGYDSVLTAMGSELSISRLKGEEALEAKTRFIAHGDAAKINGIKATSSSLVTSGMDHNVKIFDWNGTEQRVLSHHTSAVWGLAVQDTVVASSGYSMVSVSDLRAPHDLLPFSFHAHGTWVRTLHLDLERHLLVTGSCDASSKVWDLRTGEMVTKLIHPNHFEEVRSVQLVGERIFTACYDGIVREYDLLTGRLRRRVADHGQYAVESLQLRPDVGRIVSVDWSGVIACSPLDPSVNEQDHVERLCYGASMPSAGKSIMGQYRLSPYQDGNGALRYMCLGPKDDVIDSIEHTMSTSVCCLQHNDHRLLMGTKDGRLVQLLFNDDHA